MTRLRSDGALGPPPPKKPLGTCPYGDHEFAFIGIVNTLEKPGVEGYYHSAYCRGCGGHVKVTHADHFNEVITISKWEVL